MNLHKHLGLNLDFYRKSNVDLQSFTDDELEKHFQLYGVQEGRAGALESYREHFIKLIDKHEKVLEIGPFCNPILSGSNVKYFDVLDSDSLRKRAESIGYPIVTVPDIHYVNETGDLSVVDEEFDLVISSHSIEHNIDLVEHLNKVSSLLNDKGRYLVICPDKRYCFDHFICESTIADVLESHIEKRSNHRVASVIEHRALTTHNDAIMHWDGDHDIDSDVVGRLKSAIQEYKEAKGNYIDVHAWQFTPDSFYEIIISLFHMDIVPLTVTNIFQTPRGRNEFCVVLQKTT